MLQEMQTLVLKTDGTVDAEPEEKSKAVHMVVHLGNFIDVNSLLRSRIGAP